MSVKFTTIPAKRLAQGITDTDTSFRLTDIEGWDGDNLVAGDFGTQAFGVFRDANGTVLELFSFDPATIASNAIDFVDRGLQFDGDLTTEVTANKLVWPAGTIVQLGSNPPQLFQWLKEYIDDAVIAGAVPATDTVPGIGILATAAQINAGTASEGGYPLFAPPDQIALSDLFRGINYQTYAADAGVSDAYAITVAPAPAAYAAGQVFIFKAATANTGAATLNVNSLGAKTIKKNKTQDLETGDIIAGQFVVVTYDNTTDAFIVSTLADRNVRIVTAGETINGATLPVPVYQNKTDNEFYACDANDTAKYKFIGFAVSNGTDGTSIAVRFNGIVSGFSALDEGEKYYVQDAVGTIGTTPGTQEILVGVAISTTELLIMRGKMRASGTVTITGTNTSSITTGFRVNVVRVLAGFTVGGGTSASSVGYYLNGSNRSVYVDSAANASENTSGGSVTDKAWFLLDASSNRHDGVVDTVTDTGFRFNQTKNAGTDRAIPLVWEAEGEL